MYIKIHQFMNVHVHVQYRRKWDKPILKCLFYTSRQLSGGFLHAHKTWEREAGFCPPPPSYDFLDRRGRRVGRTLLSYWESWYLVGKAGILQAKLVSCR
jgi:hypothetical protein